MCFIPSLLAQVSQQGGVPAGSYGQPAGGSGSPFDFARQLLQQKTQTSLPQLPAGLSPLYGLASVFAGQNPFGSAAPSTPSAAPYTQPSYYQNPYTYGQYGGETLFRGQDGTPVSQSGQLGGGTPPPQPTYTGCFTPTKRREVRV